MQFLSMQEFLNQYEKKDPFSLQEDILNASLKERKTKSWNKLPSQKDWIKYHKTCPKYFWFQTKQIWDQEGELIRGGEKA
tara:strand:+ start:303 stop:542 length:240 start_codon:yes stop_codon:yes gene_type:complete